MKLDAIKARLGSISQSVYCQLPPKIVKLLKEDMPALIKTVEDGRNEGHSGGDHFRHVTDSFNAGHRMDHEQDRRLSS